MEIWSKSETQSHIPNPPMILIPRWVRARDLARRCKVPNVAIISAIASKKNKQLVVDLPTSELPITPMYVPDNDDDDSNNAASADITTSHISTPNHDTEPNQITRFAFPTSKSVILPYATAARIVESMLPDAVPVFHDLAPDTVQRSLLPSHDDDQPTKCAKLPIFTMLGERDHGKTTLIDHMRGDGRTTREAGGITQRVRANLTTLTPNGLGRPSSSERKEQEQSGGGEGRRSRKRSRKRSKTTATSNTTTSNPTPTDSIVATLLDTPGHGHFFEMREETSHVVDVAVVLVACDEGPGITTWEVLDACVAAELDVVVVLNKIDQATDEEIEKSLQILKDSDSWSKLPSVPRVVPTSALTGEGVDELVQVLWSHHELSMVKEEDFPRGGDTPARCTILDAFVGQGHGLTLRTVVHEGTLRTGDVFVCGLMRGRVKFLLLPDGTRSDAGPPGCVADVVLSHRTTTRKERKGVHLPRMGEGLWVLPEDSVEEVLDQRRMEGEIMSYKEEIPIEKTEEEKEKEMLEKERMEEEEKRDFVGVVAEGEMFTAAIFIEEKRKYLGTYATKREAAIAYDKEALSIGVEEKKRNFPNMVHDVEEEEGEEGEEEEEEVVLPTVVIKTDSSSSLETILAMLDEVRDPDDVEMPLIHVVHAGVGIVTSTDLKMAAVDNSKIYCYNVGLAPMLKKNQIQIIQMKLIDDLMETMLVDCGVSSLEIK